MGRVKSKGEKRGKLGGERVREASGRGKWRKHRCNGR